MSLAGENNGSIDPATGRESSTSFSLLTFERFCDHHPALSEVSPTGPSRSGPQRIGGAGYGRRRVGIVAALGASRFLESMLFGLSPGDPLTCGAVALLLVALVLLASLLPARRATRVDPLGALRAEQRCGRRGP